MKIEQCPKCGCPEKAWMERSMDGRSKCAKCHHVGFHTEWKFTVLEISASKPPTDQSIDNPCPECNREMSAVTSRTKETSWRCDYCNSIEAQRDVLSSKRYNNYFGATGSHERASKECTAFKAGFDAAIPIIRKDVLEKLKSEDARRQNIKTDFEWNPSDWADWLEKEWSKE